MPYTSHGHAYGNVDVDLPRPKAVARCGGPRICKTCAEEARQGRAEPTPAEELRRAAAKVREHPEIFGGGAALAALLEKVAEVAEDHGIQTSVEMGVLGAARAINGTQAVTDA